MDFIIYLICFGVGLLFTIISALMADVFGSHEVHVDLGHGGAPSSGGHGGADAGHHDMPGFSALSPTSIASFVTAFGGLGMILSRIEATSTPWISAPLATLGALGIAALIVAMFRTIFRRTQSSSELKVAALAGMSATVITPIPENGVGEIAYVDRGSRYTSPARTESGKPLGSGSTVRITRVVGSQLFVQSIPSPTSST